MTTTTTGGEGGGAGNTPGTGHICVLRRVSHTEIEREKKRVYIFGVGNAGKCVENVEKVSPLPQVEMFGIYQRRLQ